MVLFVCSFRFPENCKVAILLPIALYVFFFFFGKKPKKFIKSRPDYRASNNPNRENKQTTNSHTLISHKQQRNLTTPKFSHSCPNSCKSTNYHTSFSPSNSKTLHKYISLLHGLLLHGLSAGKASHYPEKFSYSVRAKYNKL